VRYLEGLMLLHLASVLVPETEHWAANAKKSILSAPPATIHHGAIAGQAGHSG